MPLLSLYHCERVYPVNSLDTLKYLKSSLIKSLERIAKKGGSLSALKDELFKVDELIHEIEAGH